MRVPESMKPLTYGALNIAAATLIVFANKAVFTVFNFPYTYALTLIHTCVSIAGMDLFRRAGLFEPKPVPLRKIFPLAAAYVGYIATCNLNLNLNPVSFYQISKIAVAPAMIAIDYVYYKKTSSARIMASVTVVCVGIAAATVTDPQMSSNIFGLAVGLASVLATSFYLIWAGTIQKECGLGSMQLLHQHAPVAALLLGILVPFSEPSTLYQYRFSAGALAALAASAVLGLLVNLSTFLVIGATNSLTYNVVGHIKTVLILAGGVAFFGDTISGRKLAGIAVAMLGVIWYTQIKLSQTKPSAKGVPAPASADEEKPLKHGNGYSLPVVSVVTVK